MLPTIGFVVLALMLAGYVLLDGYDIGVGTVSPFVAKTSAERAAFLRAIAPFWNGNEVWLIASGAVLFGLFPVAYAVSFSGFYLPLIIALWLLMFRGLSIELRETIDTDVWRTLWDALFMLSSALLAIVYGVAIGNLVRGVDLQRSGFFVGTFAKLLNPFALEAGVLALLALALHGLVYGRMRIEGELGERCTRYARRLWWLVLVVFVGVTAGAFEIYHGVDPHPILSAVLSLGSLAALVVLRLVFERPRAAFYASGSFLAILLVSAAATLFPYLIPRYPRGTGGLTIYAANPAAPPALATMLAIIVVALAALFVYRAIAAGRLTQPVRVGDEGVYG